MDPKHLSVAAASAAAQLPQPSIANQLYRGRSDAVRNHPIKNADGEILSGRLDRPLGGAPLAYAIFAHCFTCSKQTWAVAAVSRALIQRDIAVLRFDFTGLGDSQGDFAETTFSSSVEDLVRAAGYLGTLDAQQRHRLMEIADRCPVHRTLKGESISSPSRRTGSRHRMAEAGR